MPISKFKATCLAELERVRSTGKPLLITKHGKPVAQITPAPAATRRKGSFGALRHLMNGPTGDVVSPLPLEDWGIDP